MAKSRMEESGQTCLAADTIRRYSWFTPLSVARVRSLYLTTTLGRSLSEVAAPATPAAMTPARPPSNSNANPARLDLKVLMNVSLVTVLCDAYIRRARSRPSLWPAVEVVPPSDGFVPRRGVRDRNCPLLALGLPT